LGFNSDVPGFQCEGTAWRADGSIIKAISPRNYHVPLKLLGGGHSVDFYVEAAANPDVAQGWSFAPTPLGDKATSGDEPRYRFGRIVMAELNETVWELNQDIWTLSGLMHELPTELPRRNEILRALERMLDIMDPDDVAGTAAAGREALRYFPELFVRIREKVKAGQFVPVGGMWVESDTNMPGGEAMARQFVEGKSFFLKEFDVECQEAWLPDSFGYSGAIPQIVKAAGSRWFLTQKISWNKVNRMPHHTFSWEGIDGTRLFTHFPPVDTYNAELHGRELAHAERNYRDHGRGTMSLVPFGYGDGGGGPTREMVAAAHRTADLEGSPKVRMGTARDFFTKAEAEYANLPVWVGEMYLEMHRGTYTSQAKTKRGNRRSEHLLREAELWCSTAAVRLGADYEYPYQELKRLWQLVLLQQFHDILPGSSIAWVHQDAERNYEAIARDLEAIISAAATALVGPGGNEYLLNAAPHMRAGVPALGAGAATTPGSAVDVQQDAGGYVLDNGVIRAVLNADGLLSSLVDHASGREAIAPGQAGNLLELFRDTPNEWDAWDIEEFYRRNVTPLTRADSCDLERTAAGAVVVVKRKVNASTITQRITLDAGAKSLGIATTVDWQEREKMLKIAFPLDVRADRSASETQFGHVFRATHTNTSWETAKFEICAHRWIHVAEPGYGVAVSNSSSYGHDVTRAVRGDGGTTTTVRTSLLRSARFPDPEADRGEHTLELSIRPGAAIADAVEEGYRTNLAPRYVTGGHAVEPLVSVTNPAIVVEAVKLAEDGSGDVVVRLYESLGERSTGKVAPGFQAQGVAATDLLERPVDAPGVAVGEDCVVDLVLRPFQLVTLRFSRG
ncbi:alpha-mannosidase, partial [Paenarthrobacter sp. RAF9]